MKRKRPMIVRGRVRRVAAGMAGMGLRFGVGSRVFACGWLRVISVRRLRRGIRLWSCFFITFLAGGATRLAPLNLANRRSCNCLTICLLSPF
jgi:hypothetical protein